MKIIKKITFLFAVLGLSLFTSCDEGGQPSKDDIGGTTTGQYAGDWFITISDSDGNTLVEHVLHSTYNAAANDNTMWMDDHLGGYEIKSKYGINIENGAFSASESPNFYDVDDDGVPLSTVTITEGQITKMGAISKGGHGVDAIRFRVHYSYDPDGYDIIYEGHKRTGFFEDEY